MAERDYYNAKAASRRQQNAYALLAYARLRSVAALRKLGEELEFGSRFLD